ncbi:MAG: hypothetical protein LBG82_09250 [Clostridiales Family XIII bacterium]|jgi:hypothetical protein|nr:hypothetical protein [Clostridiales Family XIII bacterium]
MASYQDAKKKFYKKLDEPRNFISPEGVVKLNKAIAKRLRENSINRDGGLVAAHNLPKIGY